MNWNEEERRFEHIPGLYPHPLDPSSVRKHRDRSKQESRWECDRCGKRYKYSRGLAMHRRLECGKEPMFHCPYCPQKCHQKGNMVIHIKKKHPNNNNQPPTSLTKITDKNRLRGISKMARREWTSEEVEGNFKSKTVFEEEVVVVVPKSVKTDGGCLQGTPMIRVRSDIPNLKPLNLQNLTTLALLGTTNSYGNNQNSTAVATAAASNVMAISQHYLNKLSCLRMSTSQNWVSSSCDMYDSSSDTSVISDNQLNTTTGAANNNSIGLSDNGGNHSLNNAQSGAPRKHNREKEPIFGCLDCGKRYRSKTSLSLHKRLECGKEPAFQCPFCPLKTHQKGNLQVHIKKKHSDPRHFIGHQMS